MNDEGCHNKNIFFVYSHLSVLRCPSAPPGTVSAPTCDWLMLWIWILCFDWSTIPGAIVPDQVGVLTVAVQHLQHLVGLVGVELLGEVTGQHGLQASLHDGVVRGHVWLRQVASQPRQKYKMFHMVDSQ